MPKLLLIKASPRGAASRSVALAQDYVDAHRAAHPGTEVDVIDLWREPLPEFDGDKAQAKLSVITGQALEGASRTVWDEITAIAERFIAADHYVFAVPMWNGGIPYRLKLYIDLIHQPGLLFGFDPDKGYHGLLKNKRAAIVCTSGVYRPGIDPAFGADFHAAYLTWWLHVAGVDHVDLIRFQPTLRTQDPDAAFGMASAEARAKGRS